MPAIAVVGAQWGDEAKGHIIDLLAGRASLVVRCQGGPNAGHTVVTERGTFRLHLVPCGALRPGVRSVIGHGVVVDPFGLLEELDTLAAAGVDLSSLLLSERAHLIMPYHRRLDLLEESARGEAAIGTTGRGIGPAYADKAARAGLRVCDALSPSGRKELQRAAQRARRLIGSFDDGAPGAPDAPNPNTDPVDPVEEVDRYVEALERLRPYVGDALTVVHDALDRGETVLLEGAQAALLDLDAGAYPFVTSSCTTVAGALAGSGIPPSALTGTIGVYKAYPTRVGMGPFPSEMDAETGSRVREIGHEYGATTGRPRRCGWFDAVMARYSARLNGYSAVALTHLDVFDTFPTLRLCTGYRLRGERIDRVPPLAADLAACEPIYEEMPGWRQSTAGARRAEDLPRAAGAFIARVEELVGVPVAIVTVGPERDEAVSLRPLL